MKGSFFKDKSSFDNPMELWRESNVPGAKSEARSTKHETNPKSQAAKPGAMSWSLVKSRKPLLSSRMRFPIFPFCA